MTPRFALLSIMIAAGLSGCSAGSPPDDQARLALACETVRCQCTPLGSSFSLSTKEPLPVQWRQDGSAFCPEKSRLTRVEP